MMFSWIWKSSAVDNQHLKAIVDTKLILDERRVNAFNKGQTEDKRDKMQKYVIWINFLFGLFFAYFLYLFNHPHTAYTVMFTIIIVFLMMTLITDFTDVLIDVRDNYTIIPTPVSSQTITLSRLIHITLYLSNLIVPYVVPSLIYTVIKYGIWASLLFLFCALLAVAVSIIFVNITYMILLKFANPEKFKDIIGYFQIAFIVVILLGYYTIPYVIDFEQFKDVDITDRWWHVLFPGNYIAAPFRYLADSFSTQYILYFIGCLGVVLTGIYMIVFVLGKDLNEKLLGMNYAGNNEDDLGQVSSSNLSQRIADKLFKDPVERASFVWGWIMTSRSRDYKVKTYPMFAFAPAVFIYMLFSMGSSDDEAITVMERISEGGNEMLLIYLVLMSVLTPLGNTAYSDNFKAAEIFKALPLDKAGMIMRGIAYHTIIKYGVPMYLVTSIIVIYIWGATAITSLIIGAINIFLVSCATVLFLTKSMPFANAWQNQSKGSNLTNAFILMFAAGIIGTIHYFLLKDPIIICVYCVIAFGLCVFMHRKIGNIGWDDLK